jgi:hypothetical protein
MCAKPFLRDQVPYRLLLRCSGTREEGIALHIRLETRALFQLSYRLRATVRRGLAAEGIPEVVIAVRGLELYEQGRHQHAPAQWEHREQLPAGIDRSYCTLLLGRQRQSVLLRLRPPQVELLHATGLPIAEVVVP